MPLAGFEPAIKRLQTNTLQRTATGVGLFEGHLTYNSKQMKAEECHIRTYKKITNDWNYDVRRTITSPSVSEFGFLCTQGTLAVSSSSYAKAHTTLV